MNNLLPYGKGHKWQYFMPSHKPTFGSLNVPRKTVSDRFGHFVVFWIFCRLLDILSFIGYQKKSWQNITNRLVMGGGRVVSIYQSFYLSILSIYLSMNEWQSLGPLLTTSIRTCLYSINGGYKLRIHSYKETRTYI